MLAMAVVTCVWMLAGLRAAPADDRARTASTAQLVAHAGVVLGRTLVYFAGFALGVVVFHGTAWGLAASGAPRAADVLAGVAGGLAYAVWLSQTHPEAAAHLRYFAGVLRAPLRGS